MPPPPLRLGASASCPSLASGGGFASAPVHLAGAGSAAAAAVRRSRPPSLTGSRPSTAGLQQRQHLARGLTEPTQRQNCKAGRIEVRIGRCGSTPTQPLPVPSPCEPRRPPALSTVEGAAALQGSFNDELQWFEGRFAEMASSLRLEHLEKDAAEAEEQRRAEERRRRAERERKLRQQEKECQNPKRRVALKVEHGREFAQERAEAEAEAGVRCPTRTVYARGGMASERIEVVNVPALQARCLGLSAGASELKTVLMFADMEKQRLHWASVCNKTEHIKLNKRGGALRSRTAGCMAQRLRSQARRAELRHSSVRARQMEMYEDLVARQLEQHSSLVQATLQTSAGSLPMTRQSFPSRPASPSGRSASPHDASCGGGGSLEATLLPGDVEEAVGEKTGTAKYWRLLRGAFALLFLLKVVRRRRRAARVALDVVRGSAELARLLSAARAMNARINAGVRRLQRCFRKFVLRRKRWVEQASKVWCQVEDERLAAWASRQPGGSRQAQARTNLTDSSLSSSSSSVGVKWKSYRIPPKIRRLELSQWYSERLRTMVRAARAKRTAVDMASREHSDLRGFLTLCGFDPAEHDEVCGGAALVASQHLLPPGTLAEYLNFGEHEVLRLIASCAQQLKGTPPFQSHPLKEEPAAQTREARGGPTDLDELFRKFTYKGGTAGGSCIADGDVEDDEAVAGEPEPPAALEFDLDAGGAAP
eukprot:TRINITY_DN28366_c0_g2_i1.p1 TRINITY_DN28366_c0_g2~~TRINITY_DN28366_c0_g2_i1.p1  ORF type:complete len:736 (+),score=170.58 TRINITY_DN28366_c0_g2_i1:87-2210(+)